MVVIDTLGTSSAFCSPVADITIQWSSDRIVVAFHAKFQGDVGAEMAERPTEIFFHRISNFERIRPKTI